MPWARREGPQGQVAARHARRGDRQPGRYVGDRAGAQRQERSHPRACSARAERSDAAAGDEQEAHAGPGQPPQALDRRRCPWGKHWAFEPPQRPRLPTVKNRDWPRNAIDHFVLGRLEAEGLAPSPEAEPAILLRRLSLDLIGLPPTPVEVEQFVAECGLRDAAVSGRAAIRIPNPQSRSWSIACSPRRTSASAGPGPGSTWPATPTRTASSATTSRDLWPYRDWVIQALNADMPFDQFTVEQLAGDLLPERHPRAEDRHRLPPLHADQRRGRRRPGGDPRQPGRSTASTRRRPSGSARRWSAPSATTTSTTRSRSRTTTACSPSSTTPPRRDRLPNPKAPAALEFTGPYMPLTADGMRPATSRTSGRRSADGTEARAAAQPHAGDAGAAAAARRRRLFERAATSATPERARRPGARRPLRPASASQAAADRLALARWLVQPRQPADRPRARSTAGGRSCSAAASSPRPRTSASRASRRRIRSCSTGSPSSSCSISVRERGWSGHEALLRTHRHRRRPTASRRALTPGAAAPRRREQAARPRPAVPPRRRDDPRQRPGRSPAC